MKKGRVILCGYNWTGCEALRLLISEGYQVFVYTHEANKNDSDLAEYCRELGVDFSFEKISTDNLPFTPDIISSVYYRYIISQEVIDLVKGKIFNLHPSLLPLYKGCGSLTWAIINGEEETGFTYHYIDAGCDTGNIITQYSLDIKAFDTQQTLYQRVMVLSMREYIPALNKVKHDFDGEIQKGEGSYYKRGAPHYGSISSKWDIDYKKRFIRAMKNLPYAYAKYEGNEVTNFIELQRLQKSLDFNK
jgi:methionyl-tRNA formyltransferase